jgi:hypothetical protein
MSFPLVLPSLETFAVQYVLVLFGWLAVTALLDPACKHRECPTHAHTHFCATFFMAYGARSPNVHCTCRGGLWRSASKLKPRSSHSDAVKHSRFTAYLASKLKPRSSHSDAVKHSRFTAYLDFLNSASRNCRRFSGMSAPFREQVSRCARIMVARFARGALGKLCTMTAHVLTTPMKSLPALSTRSRVVATAA